jgi:hypothetical protein
MKTVARSCIVCISLIVIGLLFAGVSHAKVDPKTCVGLWLFDEGQGEIAKDSSGNGLDGTLMSKPKWVNGKFGKALEFDGPGQHVFIKDVLIPKTGWSISSWIYRDTNAADSIWINHNNVRKDGATLHLYFTPGNNIPRMCYHGDGAGFSPLSEIGKNVWTHIVFVVEDKGRKVYINGNLDNSDANSVGYNGDKAPLLIGMFLDCCPFIGRVDEVGVFNVALTPEEVMTIKNNGFAPVSPKGLLTAAWGEILENAGQK